MIRFVVIACNCLFLGAWPRFESFVVAAPWSILPCSSPPPLWAHLSPNFASEVYWGPATEPCAWTAPTWSSGQLDRLPFHYATTAQMRFTKFIHLMFFLSIVMYRIMIIIIPSFGCPFKPGRSWFLDWPYLLVPNVSILALPGLDTKHGIYWDIIPLPSWRVFGHAPLWSLKIIFDT